MASPVDHRGVVEGQTLERDVEAEADVCVIGSGAGGAVAAALLARAGRRVVVLEEGGYFTSERFMMREEDAYPHLYQEAGQRTTKDLSVALFQGRAVGGTTVVNWTTCFRTPDATLERWRTHHAVGHVDAQALAPHFEAVERRLNISKIDLAKVNRNNRLLWDGCKALGYEVDTLNRNVIGCAMTGYCGMGCPVDLKQSMNLTYLPDAMSDGATIVSRCRVERLELDGGRVVKAHGALLDAFGVGPTGVSITVRAKRFVVAGGAINSPALLIRSGVPDPSGRLGRRTFLHPVVVSAAQHDEEVAGYHGAPQGVASHHFAHRGDDVGFFLEAAPIYPVLMSTAFPAFGAVHREHAKRLKHFAGHLAIAIDGHHDGEEGGTVAVLPSGRPQLDYEISPKVWAALREGQKVLAKLQLASGAKLVGTFHSPPIEMKSDADVAQLDAAPFAPNRVGVFSAHIMGGCGMSDDPKRGVVRSEDLRHHQVDNLHVIDGSVFPTSTGVNPQLSIYGLAHLATTRLLAASG
ncbi:GMC family oxidoreductase [Myxococcota bacterium]|nr:GMC family oxidoreductase [Myxococcota bacterium]